MKVVTILGSPRKKGNTAAVLGMFEEIIGKDHEVDRINIADVDVKGCKSCYTCQQTADEPACVQKDDAAAIFERIMEADAVIYATPLYCWSFTAQIKALLDRHFCLVTGYGTPDHKSLVDGKKMALLVTCMGPVEKNADFIPGIFSRMVAYMKGDVAGKYVLPGCTTPDEMGGRAMDIAQKMAADIMD